jgi:predicted anti-sigma-YlaC factor YlaD
VSKNKKVKMDCSTVEKKIISYSEKMLQEVEISQIDLHLAQCNSCRLKFELYKELEAELDFIKNTAVTPYIFTRIKARMDNKGSKSQWWQPAGYTLAASLSIGLLAGIILGKTIIPDTGQTLHKIGLEEVFNDGQLENSELFILNQ